MALTLDPTINDPAPNGLLHLTGPRIQPPPGGGLDRRRWGPRLVRSFGVDGTGETPCKDDDPCQKTVPGRVHRGPAPDAQQTRYPAMDPFVQRELIFASQQANVPVGPWLPQWQPPAPPKLFAPQAHDQHVMSPTAFTQALLPSAGELTHG